jgi:predicted GH43/DUF377 family glycosyl hydrolase
MKVILSVLLATAILSCQTASTEEAIAEKSDAWAMTNFVKADDDNPILTPTQNLTFDCPVRGENIQWEGKNVLNPAAFVKDGKVYLVYRAQDEFMTSRLGLAISEDGINFVKQGEPIFYPANDNMKQYEWPGGVEDPRIVESDDGRYILTYTSYDGKTARLCVASSTDLKTWTKHGIAFGDEKYKDMWAKSGAIVSRQEGSRTIATKIDGKYWMYFGDTKLFIATSDDLVTWKIAESAENQNMVEVLHPRAGYFDSRLVEPGPYALIRDEGILLIYNASNAANFNEEGLKKFTYAAGQALYSKEKPYQLLKRTDDYFIHPEKDYEKVGEVNDVCFVEGMVSFKGKWFLYYGTADSKIATAVMEE